MLDHYRMFAAYNAWANRTLYTEVGKLDDDAFRRDTGTFFGSLHRTLNHLLTADRIWMKRFTGIGDAPTRLDTILHEDFSGLWAARQAEDARLVAYADSLSEETIAADFTYSPLTNPTVITHPLRPALTHMFNHQTHHRGQCHGMLTAVGGPSITLDLIYFARTEGKEFL
ncbi:diguanylate cyclase [Shinella sp. SUS2]|uniref:DinB family protein n=1 Tax=unclassified Shinella TaxID=2643062 RepID=UPI0003C5373F|nr:MULTISPECIES: DinB family protein [unclassified Shinella]MCA0340216.1 DinB family protein [Pseudomonadota bacterium]EYR78790.1 DinB family protein [Shinella sp. DD12]KNY18164.1 diguanylate cyclase [Shinella sp. SUS2]KOC77359.1 diguanylate cyclase [Shinella sp. GWS1]MDG4671529.1 DinB family protein [Shinella sp. 838]